MTATYLFRRVSLATAFSLLFASPWAVSAQTVTIPNSVSSTVSGVQQGIERVRSEVGSQYKNLQNTINKGVGHVQNAISGNHSSGNSGYTSSSPTLNGEWPTQKSAQVQGEDTNKGGNNLAYDVANENGTDGQVQDKPPVAVNAVQGILWAHQGENSAYQRGVGIPQALHHGVADVSDRATEVWLEEWRQDLVNRHLVSNQRFWFQARRLSRKDFALWASRISWQADGVEPTYWPFP